MVRNGQKADGILGDFFADEMIVSEACDNHFDWMGCLGLEALFPRKLGSFRLVRSKGR